MFYLVTVDHNGMTGCHKRNDFRVLRCAVYPVQWMGMLGEGVRKMETVTLIGKGR